MRRARLAATITALLVLLATAAPAHASGGRQIRQITGRTSHTGVTVFHLGHVRPRAITRARVRVASGRHVRLRLRRVRAGTRGGVLRLHLRVRRGRKPPVLSIQTTAPAAPTAAHPPVATPDPVAPATAAVSVPSAPAAATLAEPKPAAASGNSQQPSSNLAAVSCDRYAAPGGSDSAAGTTSAPFASAQHLLDALAPGQTGCLRSGRYAEYELKAHRSGTPSAPITLAAAPGEQATIAVDTDIYLPDAISDVRFRDLSLTNRPASGITQAVMIQDFSERSVWDGNRIDGNADAHCMELGWAGNAVAHETLIRRNRFTHCGNPANGNQEHGIYLAESTGATITENVFSDVAAYAIHLYPNADHTTVTHNVIVGAGYGGVIFASDQSAGTGRTSDDNTVAYNVISGGARFGMEVFWGASGRGSGNAAHDNCLSGNAAGAFAGAMDGVTLTSNTAKAVSFADAAHGDYRLAAGDPCLAVVGFDAAALLGAA